MLHALALFLAVRPQTPPATPKPELPLSTEQEREAGRVAGLDFTDAELTLMLPGVCDQLAAFEQLRAVPLANSDSLALGFSSVLAGTVSARVKNETLKPLKRELPQAKRPANLEDLAFADIGTLSMLLKSRQVTCTELVELSLARLKRLDPKLLCVVTLCEDRARKQAAERDADLARGYWRGPLHGMPWGAKDLLSTKGIRTTWGSKIFENQVIDADAAVVERLDQVGAILVAKLSLGELAWGDVWYGGTTKTPWKLDEGSSGSSAGPASATAAGCVVFAIGSETCGSILSPSAQCGNSSLRPTFGRVSRRGAMALAWSMDKLGPICRSLADVSLVFGAIQGPDALDDYVLNRPYTDLGPVSVAGMKVGYLKGAWRATEEEQLRLDELKTLGCDLVPVELPKYPLEALMIVLSAEAATAFDDLTRNGEDERMVRQVEHAWPNVFRQARLIPAVEYLRANRIRRKLMADVATMFESIDVLLHPTTDESTLIAFNLTGNPTVCAPTALGPNGIPGSVSFSGPVLGEARLLALAEAWQRATGFHNLHPKLE